MNERGLEKFSSSLDEGVSSATKVLARMVRLPLASKPARILDAERAAPPTDLLPAGNRLLAGVVPLSGDVFGHAMLVFPADAAAQIASSLAEASRVSVPEAAAFEEVANIFVNMALAAITRNFRLAIYPSPPTLARGTPGAVWSAFAGAIAAQPTRSAVLRVDLETADQKIHGRFLLALRSDSLDTIRWKSTGQTDKRIDVKMGDMGEAASPAILKVTSLGSCLAVILYDPVRKFGAIAHVMLPSCSSPELTLARPGKYADTAVEALLKSFPGAARSSLRVWMIGGANMLSQIATGPQMLQIGRRNIEMVKKSLAAAGLFRYSEEIGGTTGRTVELDTQTGEVSIRVPSGEKRVIPPPAPPASPQPQKSPKP